MISKELEVHKLILTNEKSLMHFTSLICWGAYLNWTSCRPRQSYKIYKFAILLDWLIKCFGGISYKFREQTKLPNIRYHDKSLRF